MASRLVHEFSDWQVLISSRAGKRALYGNPNAPAKPAHSIYKEHIPAYIFAVGQRSCKSGGKALVGDVYF